MKFVYILFSMLSFLWAGDVAFTGIRTSRYGISPYPTPAGWHNAIHEMAKYYPMAKHAAIWTTGVIWDRECHLYFPNDNNYPVKNISYSSSDLNEEYLSYFDTAGISVFLQVEPADADIKTLVDIIMSRYSNHKSVIGFGIDAEWYLSEDNTWGKKVTDAEAEKWIGYIQSYNKEYKLFIKHPDRTPTHFPPNYRKDLIFVNDCEGLKQIDEEKGFDDLENDYLGVMQDFAEYAYPAPVFYQVGYPSIQTLWANFDPKPKVLGDSISGRIPSEQEIGIFWVDFGMEGVLPHNNNWTPEKWPTDIKNFLVTKQHNLNRSDCLSPGFFLPNGRSTLNLFYNDTDRLARGFYIFRSDKGSSVKRVLK